MAKIYSMKTFKENKKLQDNVISTFLFSFPGCIWWCYYSVEEVWVLFTWSNMSHTGMSIHSTFNSFCIYLLCVGGGSSSCHSQCVEVRTNFRSLISSYHLVSGDCQAWQEVPYTEPSCQSCIQILKVTLICIYILLEITILIMFWFLPQIPSKYFLISSM